MAMASPDSAETSQTPQNPTPTRSHFNRPWSDLPQELLHLISSHLVFADLIRFSAVCTSWRSVSVTTPHNQALHHSPWMLCLEHPSPQISITSNPEDPHKVQLLHLPTPPPGRCIGSHKNWLVMADGRIHMRIILINPLSGIQIPLPRRLRFPQQTLNIAWNYFHKAILSSAPTPGAGVAGDCVVVALKMIGPQLALCRPGGDVDEWVLFPAAREGITGLLDIMFHEGTLYGLTSKYHVVGFALNSLDLVVARVYRPVEPLSLRNSIGGRMFLVGVAGKLFMAFKHLRQSGWGLPPPPFSVFELHLEGNQWVEVKSLDDHVIFLATNYTRSFMAADNSSGGCIYFIDMPAEGCQSPYGVFCLKGGSTRPIFLHWDTPTSCRPFWFLQGLTQRVL